MIAVKNKNHILPVMEKEYRDYKKPDNGYSFVFSDNIKAWTQSKDINKKKSYRDAKPLF